MLCLAHRCTLLGNIVTMLASCSPQPSSIPTYKRAWRLFHQFLHAVFQTVSPILPVSPNTIALFIAYMFDKQYAPSTVSSYVSALSFAHKFLGFDDPTKAFFVTQILKGYHKQGSRLDSRLPITFQSCTNYSIRHVNWPFVDIKFVNSRPCVIQPFMPFYGLVR